LFCLSSSLASSFSYSSSSSVQSSLYAQGPTANNSNWLSVDRILTEASEGVAPNAASTGPLSNYTFQVYTVDASAQPQLNYSRSFGNVEDSNSMIVAASPDAHLKIASATKQITSLTILHAIYELNVTMGDLSPLRLKTTASILNCPRTSDQANNITLDQLLHQIAGLSKGQNKCIQKALNIKNSGPTPLRSCACNILTENLTNNVGKDFVYSANNFTVAGAIAEQALVNSGITNRGKLFNYYSWFDHTLSELGLVSSDMFYSNRGNVKNLSLAGGLTSTATAYARFLTPTVPGPNQGFIGNTRFLNKELLSAFSTPFSSSVKIISSPFNAILGPSAPTLRYGLGNWVECSQNVWNLAQWPSVDYSFLNLDYANCDRRIDQSIGKFGYFPWVSSSPSTESYIAILATRLKNSGGEKVDHISADLHFMLEPVLDKVFKN